MHFYKINWYDERKDYLTLTETLPIAATSFKPGPEKYLTDEMNKRELSSYLGPEGKGKGKGKGGKSNKRKNNKRKNKTKKSYRKSKIRKNKRTRR